MRILSALIITYCCGCVVPENSNEEHKDLGNLENSLSSDIIIQIGSKENPFYNCLRRSRRQTANLKSRRRSHSRKMSGSRSHRGKVASHNHRIPGSSPRHRTLHAHRKIKNAADGRDDKQENLEQSDEDVGWDDWGDWTKCSVTCGNGRKVRWRHCISEQCPIRGLKLAQMKTCHFEDCPPKGVLSWFGIKS